MKTLNIYLAAQAVMYLPVFVAKEKGLFSTLIPDTKINLCTAEGDYDAISKMHNDNLSTDDTFAIAIADPNAIKNVEDARIIRALIDRLSFWGVSKKNIDCHKNGISKSEFEKVVHYDKNLITGYQIGLTLCQKEGITDCQTTKTLGNEFKYLNKKNIIITPDLLRVAIQCVNNNAHINYHFAKADRYLPNNYITTAIITSKWCINNSEETAKLIRVIEAIQKAKSIIYSSKQIAREILINMDCMKNVAANKKVDVANFIIQIINDDRIYPSDLNISKEQWESTNTNSDKVFSEYVYNDIVLEAERIIAQQFGITVYDTFAEIIETEIKKPYVQQINALEAEIRGLKKNSLKDFLNWCAKHWFHIFFWPSLVYTAIWMSMFFMSYEWTNTDVAKIFATSFAIPIIISLLHRFFKW